VLIHLLSAEEVELSRLLESYRTVENELALYSERLRDKPRLVALTKVDLLPGEERIPLATDLAGALALEVLPISAVTGWGLDALVGAAARLVGRAG
jgi:GTP-binding protein